MLQGHFQTNLFSTYEKEKPNHKVKFANLWELIEFSEKVKTAVTVLYFGNKLNFAV